MKLQLVETKKLFYDRYLYKVSIRNSLAHLFRAKKFDVTKYMLDALQTQHDNLQPLTIKSGLRQTTISQDTFLHAKSLYNRLHKAKVDFLIRVENPIMNIYANDEDWILQFAKDAYLFSRPEDVNLMERNVIITDTPTDYPIKITLGEKINTNNFANWLENNSDKVKIGPVCLDEIKNNGFLRGLYFYVRDEKVLTLVNLALGGGIQRIDKIVCTANIDK